MKCPHCNVDLVMSERQGIEIDYCPQCRGVWLDRGELDKIMERAGQTATAAPPTPMQREWDDDDDWKRRGHGKPYRKSWLSELFD